MAELEKSLNPREGGNPYRTLVFLRPNSGGGEVANGLTDAGTGVGG